MTDEFTIDDQADVFAAQSANATAADDLGSAEMDGVTEQDAAAEAAETDPPVESPIDNSDKPAKANDEGGDIPTNVSVDLSGNESFGQQAPE